MYEKSGLYLRFKLMPLNCLVWLDLTDLILKFVGDIINLVAIQDTLLGPVLID